MAIDCTRRKVYGTALGVGCIVVMGIAAAETQEGANRQPSAKPEVAEVLHTARAIVRGGQSAGIVVKLDRSGRAGGAPLFDLDESAGRVPPLPSLRGHAGEMLRRHSERSSRFEVKGNVLSDGTAVGCGTFLDRQITVDTSAAVLPAVVAIFNAGSGQKIPAGVVGSCGLEVAKGTRDSVRLSGAYSVGEALDQATMQVSGVVWLAVEDVHGSCSIGLYGRDGLREPPGSQFAAGDGTFCMVQIGNVP